MLVSYIRYVMQIFYASISSTRMKYMHRVYASIPTIQWRIRTHTNSENYSRNILRFHSLAHSLFVPAAQLFSDLNCAIRIAYDRNQPCCFFHSIFGIFSSVWLWWRAIALAAKLASTTRLLLLLLVELVIPVRIIIVVTAASTAAFIGICKMQIRHVDKFILKSILLPKAMSYKFQYEFNQMEYRFSHP